MPRTIAEILRATAPQDLGDDDDNTVNAHFVGALLDPEKRPRTVQYLKRVVPGFGDAPDDDLADALLKSTGPRISRGDQVKDQKSGQIFKAGIQSRAKALHEAPALMAENGGADAPRGLKAATEGLADTVGVGYARPEGAERIRSVETYADLERLQRENPGSKIHTPTLSDRTQLLNSADEPLAILESGASVKGGNTLQRLVGTNSALQQGVTSLLEGRAGPDMANTGRGYRELGADVGEKLASSAPGREPLARSMPVREAIGAAGEWATGKKAAWDQAQSTGWDAVSRFLENASGQPWVPAGPAHAAADVAGAYSKENAKDAADYRGMEQQIRSTNEDLARAQRGELPPGQAEEMARLSGKMAGQDVGEVVSTFTPNEITLLPVGKIAKAATKIPGADKVLGAPAKAAGWVTEQFPRAAEFVSNIPSAWALRGGQKEAVRAAEARGMNAGQVAAREADELLRGPVEELFQRIGITNAKRQKAILKEAYAVWHDPALRRTASDPAKEVIRTLQPLHRQLFDTEVAKGVLPDTLEYNPFHLNRGQDITRQAMMNENSAKLMAEAGGVVPWKAKTHAWDEVADVPGMESFADEAARVGTAPATMKSADQIAKDMLARAELDSGFKPGLRSEIQAHIKDMQENDVLTGMIKTAQRGTTSSTRPVTEAAAELKGAIPALRAEAMKAGVHDFAPLAERFGGKVPVAQNIGAKGTEKAGFHMTKEVLDHLRETNSVLVRVVENAPTDVASGARVVELPKAFAFLDGMQVPKHFALAAQQLAVPLGKRASARAGAVARTLDNALGFGQLKQLITQGNMGFEARNIVGNMARAATHNPESLSLGTRELAARVSSAKLTDQTPIVIGGKIRTLGDLHRDLLTYGGIGQGATGRMLGVEGGQKGIGQINEWALSAGGRFPRVADAANALGRAAVAPGKAVNAAADAAGKTMFSINGHRLASHYTTDDGIRMASMLQLMKEGASPQAAAREMKHILIDYASTSGLKESVGTIVPFIKYYAGAFQGAAELALKHPDRFRKFANAMRAVERTDQALEGGAWDPRGKPLLDRATLSPQIMGGGETPVTLRAEQPASEVANLMAMAAGTPGIHDLLPDEMGRLSDERGLQALLAPWIGSGYAAATGKDMATGRSIYGMSPEEMKRFDTGAYDQYQGALTEQEKYGIPTLGESPRMNAAYNAMKYTPMLGGRFMPPQEDLLARSLMGLGNLPASRSSDSSASALQRGILSALTGIRGTAQNRQQYFARENKRAAEAIPEMFAQTRAKKAKRP